MYSIQVKEDFLQYSADITAGALKVPESRVVAGLLLRGVTDREWRTAIYDENVLQARSPKTAKRLSVLIRGRLDLVEEPLWKLIHEGSVVEATHACLAAAIKASHLLGTSSTWLFGTNIGPFKKRCLVGCGRSTSKIVVAVIPICRSGATLR